MIIAPIPAFSLDVSTYGAIGDCTNLTVNTTSNSTSVTFSQNVSLRLGETVEIFGAGNLTTLPNHQDLVATLSSVSGANATLSTPAMLTGTGLYCIIGTNNVNAFQAAHDALGTGTTITIPAGNYLLISYQQLGTPFGAWYMGDIYCTNHVNWIGAGRTATTLTGDGAWGVYTNFSFTGRSTGEVYRGFMFVLPDTSPSIYFSLSSMTIDGGLQNGFSVNTPQPASVVDGTGWDQTHDALVDISDANRYENINLTNCIFQNWRGEVMKSVGSSTNGFAFITNCIFRDNNATAMNIYPAKTTTGCLFTNMSQVEEYYQLRNNHGTSWFMNNTIWGMRGIAFNGGTGTNSWYIISNNTFNAMSDIAMLTASGSNIRFCNNTVNGGTGATLGSTAGVIPFAYPNANIIINDNTLNCSTAVQVGGGEAGNNVINCLVSNNISGGLYANFDSSHMTNVVLYGNIGGRLNNAINNPAFFTDAGYNAFDAYNVCCYDAVNLLDYKTASIQSTHFANNGLIYLPKSSDCVGLNIINNTFTITNNNNNGNSVFVQATDLSDNPIGSSLLLPNNGTATFYWTSTGWSFLPYLPTSTPTVGGYLLIKP